MGRAAWAVQQRLRGEPSPSAGGGSIATLTAFPQAGAQTCGREQRDEPAHVCSYGHTLTAGQRGVGVCWAWLPAWLPGARLPCLCLAACLPGLAAAGSVSDWPACSQT